MKKILFTLTLFGFLALSTPVYAQQQINNDGATGSDLQQQYGSENIQQNGSAQQTSDVTNNAGASVLQNAPNQPLEVTGAPAGDSTDSTSSPFRWVVIAGLFLLILLSPALLYVRALQNTGEITDDIAVLKAPRSTTKEEQPAKSEPSPAKTATTTKEKEKSAKKKSKKSSGNKTKRGKKAKK